MTRKVFDAELTTNCRLNCPKCSRSVDANERDFWNKGEMSFVAWKNLVVNKTIDKLHLCGCYGDPIYHSQLIEFIKYRNENNPVLDIGIETNGSHRSKDWWETLGKALANRNDELVFSIDGLEDTNHLYRIGSDFKSIIAGAKAVRNIFNGEMRWNSCTMLLYAYSRTSSGISNFCW